MPVRSLRHIHAALFPAGELLLGMGLAQAVATLQVHASNLRLLAKMTAVAEAGFLPVPNQLVLPLLSGLQSAFWGGLFFTLSAGAGITLLSVGAALALSRLRGRCGLAAGGACGLWAAVLLCMNSHGFDLWVTLYVLLIPPPVFGLALKHLTRAERPSGRRFWLTRAVPILLLALGWFASYDQNLFIDVRDHVLMSNPAGDAVNSFYYRYTLFPAEVFKPLNQKQITTALLTPAVSNRRQARVSEELIWNDLLPVRPGSAVDLTIECTGDRLVFRQHAEVLADVTIERFLADSRGVLNEISAKSDRWDPFRWVTYWGVLVAFPIVLYVLVFALLRLCTGVFFEDHRADLVCAAACLLVGFGILAGFVMSRAAQPQPAELAPALVSGPWQKQVAALKAIREQGLDICDLPGWRDLHGSPRPQVRYWLGKALAASRTPEASAELTRLLNDPHLNVRTMALEGLAQRHDRSAVARIRAFIAASNDWYDQFYAYRALRALGWKQTASR
jgi:hypothetical protein